jgi:hypothetical protein
MEQFDRIRISAIMTSIYAKLMCFTEIVNLELIKRNQYSGCFKLARVHAGTIPAHVQQAIKMCK